MLEESHCEPDHGDPRDLRTLAWKEAVLRLESEKERFRFLAEASEVLSSSLEYGSTLQAVADLAVPRIADWCSVEVLEGTRLKQVAVAHVDAAKVQLARELYDRWPTDPNSPTGTANVLRTGKPELYEEIPDELLEKAIRDPERLRIARELQLRSAMAVPLNARGRTLGAVTLIWAESNQRYHPDDLPLMVELGRRAGQAVDNARLYHEAREAVRLRDEFLSVASHELKTPLTSLQLQVSGIAQSLRRTPLQLDRLAGRVELVDRQVTRLARLVENLLDVSRATAGRLPLDLRPVDLTAVVRTVVEQLKDELAVAHCDLRLELPAGDGVVGRWDEMRLEQVVGNFITNAIKYGAGRPIEVAVTRSGDRALLSVRDQGIGIARVDQSRIWERFGRAVSEEHYGGLGLGLWIVKELVEGMGGTVGVESEAGQGARFLAELSLSGPPESAETSHAT